jgi:DNA-directed RNA polymerase specialized sigma24 family protein
LSRRALQSDVGEFIAARSDRLLRTAYLLTGDRERAEDLLQQALSRVWSNWSRSELGPDLTARRELVRGMKPWRRRGASQETDDVLAALARLPRRQRAALVLGEVDRLSDVELADVLECAEPIAHRLRTRARAAFPGGDPAAALESVTVADEPSDSTLTTIAQRLGHVEHRVDVRRRRRRIEVIASLVVATVAAIVVAVVLAPGAGDDDQTLPAPDPGARKPPPVIVGHQLPPILHVGDVNYDYADSVVSRGGDARLRVVVPERGMSQAVTWVTPWTLKGPVDVRVDGELVSHTGAGPLGAGVLLTSHNRHVVVVEATRPLPETRLGLAIYHFPRL